MNSKHPFFAYWCLLTSELLLTSRHSAAQTGSGALEEIIVTAQKREQSLQDVSAAVTVVGMDRLRSGQINNLEDLALIVPNMYLGNDFNMAKLFIRGVGANTSTTGSEPGVAVHVDGAVIARAEGQLTSLFDLERVEVLRGPQGTLYGRNAVGGSINLITAKPTEAFEGYARVTVGDYDLLGLEGAVSGPISDRVLGRFAFKSEDRSGFGINPVTGNDVDNLNRQMFRGHLQFLPSENFDILLSAEYFTQADASRALKFRAETFPGHPTLLSSGVGGFAAASRDLASEVDAASETETFSITGTFNWRLNDNITITNVTNIREFEGFITQDLDISAIQNSARVTGFNSSVQRRDIDSEQFSTEFQFNYASDRLNAVVGLFYFDEDQAPVDTVGFNAILGQPGNLAHMATNAFPSTILNPGPNQVLGSPATSPAVAHAMCNTAKYLGGGISGQSPPEPKRVCIPTALSTEAFALFGQATIKLGENFSVKVGGRFNDETITTTNPAFILAGGGLGPVLLWTSADNSAKKSFDDFTPELGIEWRAGEDTLLYYTYSEGFKAGAGQNGTGTIIVDPEEIENHEIGLKTTFFDNRLAFNIAAFSYDLTGQQINKTINDPGGAGFVTVFENAALTSADGVEVEFFGAPTDQFRLSGSVAYLDSQYDDFTTFDPNEPRNIPGSPENIADGLLEVQLAGNPTRNSPELTANLHLEYDFSSPGAGGYFSLMGDVSYKDDIFFTEFHRLLEGAKSYTMVDLNLRYTSGNENVTADLWVKNAGDVDRESSTFALATARTIGVTYLPPRTYGFTLGYNF